MLAPEGVVQAATVEAQMIACSTFASRSNVGDRGMERRAAGGRAVLGSKFYFWNGRFN
jgi:hypothetical protein